MEVSNGLVRQDSVFVNVIVATNVSCIKAHRIHYTCMSWIGAVVVASSLRGLVTPRALIEVKLIEPITR